MARSEIMNRSTVFGTLLACCTVVSCRSKPAPVIAVVPETTAQELWESEHAGVERAARSFGWSVYWNGPSREDDVQQQIQILNRAISRDVTGLILSPDHAIALISPVRSALAKGIPTVIVGSPLGITPGDKLSFVVNDDAATGRLVAQRLKSRVKSGDTVVILGVNPAMISLMERARAVESALHDALPRLRVIESHNSSFGFAESEENADEAIRTTPNLRAIVALGIIPSRAAASALFTSNRERRVILIGCDQDLDLVRLLREGYFDAIIAENTSVMGSDAVSIIADELSGKTPQAEYVVEPMLITRDNVDQPDVQQLLDMNWEGQ